MLSGGEGQLRREEMFSIGGGISGVLLEGQSRAGLCDA